MKKKIRSIFFLILFLIIKIFLWFQKPYKKTIRIYDEISKPWNIFYPPTLIGKRIFLGSCVQASDEHFLEYQGVTHIVNVSSEIPNFYSHQYQYYNLKIQDNGQDSFKKEMLESVFFFINKTLMNKNNKILIHCYSGRSRSVTVLTYYLHQKLKLPIEIIVDYLKKKREIINPSVIFYDNLKNFQNSSI